MNRLNRRRLALSTLPLSGLVAACAVRPLLAATVAPTTATTATPKTAPMATAPVPDYKTPMSQTQFERHVFNRLAFGPRPGDIEKLHALGFRRWLDAQLAPQTLNNAPVEAKIARLQNAQASSAQLLEAYKAARTLNKQNQQQKQQEAEALAANGNPANGDAADAGTVNPGAMDNPFGAATPDAMADTQTPATQRNRRQKFMMEQTPATKTPATQTPAMQNPDVEARKKPVQNIGAMVADKLARAVESPRQLQEVLVDFWSNHFNEDVRKGITGTLKMADERDVIRPHILGSFRDLLGASAKSPAMLFYLDNASSTREQAPQQQRFRNRRPQAANPNPAQPAKAKRGLNENYARELMELHTLGVDAGYTQKDVTEVARCFTGWSLDRISGEFIFRASAHDTGEKTVLGQTIPAGGGIQDGERVLDILAAAPATAHHLSYQLCRRFVADNPPTSLVDRVAGVFTRTKGDLREVVRAIALSPEFASQSANRAKIKSPWEFAISSVRALDGQFLVPYADRPMGEIQLLAMGAASMQKGGGGGGAAKGRAGTLRAQLPFMMAPQIATMGQPLYAQTAPTGYPEVGTSWVSSGALVARLNFALSLTGSKVPDVSLAPLTGQGNVNDLITTLLGGQVSEGTRRTLQAAADGGADRAKLTALVLGSPEFQRR